ncbi:hypothetical protein [Burkholderia sp. AU45388]|uniref:hypothetical protein n=1 Tax=Burkholderia sp. AU45388 TaxID=3059206 RepID=UPI002656D012|nr:hypothetical protein [Burkholderia sp. AU45388]MDN7429100.1 hypothetical protein [Burkholderia sp. AU45388]
MKQRILEDHCWQVGVQVVLTFPPLSCNQIDNGCYVYKEGRCQKLRDIEGQVAARAKHPGDN